RGLTIYLAGFPSARSLTTKGVPPRAVLPPSRRSRRDRRVEAVHKKPSTLTSKVLGSGDVLLSHGLSPYYHRGCSVSLPCSEWERVVPLRDNHQKFTPLQRGKFLVRDSRFVKSLQRPV